jgi:hypothetical protein
MPKKAVKKTDLVSTYQRVFSSKDGEEVLNDLIKQYYLMTPTFGRSVNPDLMLIREGQRSVILSILRTLDIDVSRMRKHISDNNKEIQESIYE